MSWAQLRSEEAIQGSGNISVEHEAAEARNKVEGLNKPVIQDPNDLPQLDFNTYVYTAVAADERGLLILVLDEIGENNHGPFVLSPTINTEVRYASSDDITIVPQQDSVGEGADKTLYFEPEQPDKPEKYHMTALIVHADEYGHVPLSCDSLDRLRASDSAHQELDAIAQWLLNTDEHNG